MTEKELNTERQVHDLRVAVSDLLKLRIDPRTANLLNCHEGELLSALAALQVLCNELREERVMEAAE